LKGFFKPPAFRGRSPGVTLCNFRIVLFASALLATSARAQQPRAKVAASSEKLEAAADNIARMKAAQKQVLGRAEQARNERDVVKLNCVNEKLTQMKALIKVAEQSDLALHESLAARDSGGDAEFSKIAIARTKVDGLRAESEACIGQLAYLVDDKTTVEMDQPYAVRSPKDAGLGVVNRQSNPADVGAGLGAYGAHGGHEPGRGPPFAPPPIVRPPPASPYR
jgi:hypothetical protein